MSKKCTPLWREAHFQVKSVKNWRSRTTFGSWDVQKVHALVAWITCPSQNVPNTPFSDHFWKLRCRKSARRCGAKHISKSTASDVVFRGRRKGSCTLSKVSKTYWFSSFNYNYDYTTQHYTPIHYITLHYTALHYTTPHSTTLHSLQHTTLQYTPLHYILLHYTLLHFTTLRYT